MPESGPAQAEKQQQLQSRAPETAGSDSEFLPPGAIGILDLQRKAGNRAVTAAIQAGGLWSRPGAHPMPVLQLMPAVQRSAGNRAALMMRRVVQREQGAAAAGTKLDSTKFAETITTNLHKAVRRAHSNAKHVQPGQADNIIAVIDAYTKMYTYTELRFLFSEPDDLYELLAPWGFVGRSIKINVVGQLADDQAVDSLLAAIAAWKADDAKARAQRRAKMRNSYGYWERPVNMAERAKDDAQIEAGPSRDSPADRWEDTTEGTRAQRRNQRADLRNQRALDKMAGIKNQGPGGFVGMAIGGLVGAIAPNMTAQQGAEAGMEAGALLDAIIMVHAAAGEMAGAGGGAPDRFQDSANIRRAGEREQMPTPDLPGGGPAGGRAGPRNTSKGMGAMGPAGEGAPPRLPAPGDTQAGLGAMGAAGEGAGPRPGRRTSPGMGVTGPGGGGRTTAQASKTISAGPVAPVTPEEVVRQFNGDSNTVNHSASDYWHTIQWIDALMETKQWDFTKGPVPPPPLAFRVKGGHLVVNDLQWVKEGRPIRQITEPSRWGSGGGAGGGGKGGTQVGVPAGPGGSSAKGPGGTEVGVAPGPGGSVKPAGGSAGRVQMPLKVPSGPPPVPPGNVVRPASPDEVLAAHAKDPYRIVLHVDNPEWHQYIWELRNWQDGKRVTSPAPTAFHVGGGYVYVFSNSWQAEGRDPHELLPPRQLTELEAAKTMPGGQGGGGGAGSTAVSIAPGANRKK